MQFGISSNILWQGVPVAEVAATAEALGFESLWMGEHPILPVDIANPNRHGVDLPDNYRHMPDPFVWLTAAATATSRLRLGLNICLVPQRNPLILAKQAASLDHISNGRLIMGVGSGWIEEEAPIMGYEFRQRGPRTHEFVEALKTLWTEEQPSFEGEHISFPPLYSYPKPVQQPHLPLLLGAGNHNTDNTRVLKLVAKHYNGWLPVFLDPAQMRQQLAQLKEYCELEGRDFSAMDITLLVPAVTLGVGERPTFFGEHDAKARDAKELVAEYEDAGVKRILCGLVDMTRENGVQAIEAAAKGLGLH